MNPDLFWAQVLLAFAKLQATPARPGEARVGLTGCLQRNPSSSGSTSSAPLLSARKAMSRPPSPTTAAP